MVEIVKGQDRNRTQTVCRITAPGRRSFLEYLETLEQVIRDAASGKTTEAAAKLVREWAASRA